MAQEHAGATGTAPAAWHEAWRLQLSRGASATPVVDRDQLFVASLDRNVHIVSLAGDKPKVVWNSNFKGGFASPPVVEDREIILGEMIRGGRLVVLDRVSRREIWSAAAGDLMARPVVTRDAIYTVSSVGVVKAFDRTGVERWELELETRVVSNPVLVSNNLVVAATDGTLFEVGLEDGELLGTLESTGGAIWSAPLVLPDGTVIYATLDGQLIGVGPGLEVVQRRSFPTKFYGGPAAEGDRLYIVGHDGAVWAYDWEAAEILWQRDLDAGIRAALLVGPAYIAIGDLGGWVHVLDRETGEDVWSTRTNDALTAAPVAYENGFMVISERGTLYRFEPGPGGE